MKKLNDILNKTKPEASYCSDEELTQLHNEEVDLQDQKDGDIDIAISNIETVLEQADSIHQTLSSLKNIDSRAADELTRECKAFAEAFASFAEKYDIVESNQLDETFSPAAEKLLKGAGWEKVKPGPGTYNYPGRKIKVLYGYDIGGAFADSFVGEFSDGVSFIADEDGLTEFKTSAELLKFLKSVLSD